jgi:predicted secreted protein
VALAAVRNFSVEITADTIETSAMGNDTRTFVKGLSQFSGSADIYFDPTEFNGNVTTFNIANSNVAVGSGSVAVKFYIDQDATNDIAFVGNCIITGYTVNSSFDGLVEASISFQGSGGTTFSITGNV